METRDRKHEADLLKRLSSGINLFEAREKVVECQQSAVNLAHGMNATIWL